MKTKTIENPIINSPFEEPARHFRFDESGITDDILTGRRNSTYRLPGVPGVKKHGKLTIQEQLGFDDSIMETEQENPFVNELRAYIRQWRRQDYSDPNPTRVTRRLLDHWKDPERQNRRNRLFYCQLEAVETAIYLTEAAPKFRPHLIQQIRDANKEYNPGLPFRIALKMATGSGKTMVMAMLIAWQTLNKVTYKQDKRFSDSFLVITPGITIKDRLRVLYPNDVECYYKTWDLVPEDLLPQLEQLKIIITNYHSFQLKEKVKAGKLTKAILTKGKDTGAFTETPQEMVRRVCRGFGNKRDIIVINDEAHHCYLPKSDVLKLKGDDKKEAKLSRERAARWINGLIAVRKKIGIKAVYDLSATPFFLQGSGYGEGRLFPWVVSDFSLVDAVECGIVKVPRLPIADNTADGDMPMYRQLWIHIKDELPKHGRKKEDASGGEPKLPMRLEGALHALYSDYMKYFKQWEEAVENNKGEGELTPPVFIIVCNNTNVSKLVYDYVSGWEKLLPGNEDTVVVPGALKLFSNEEDKGWRQRPFSILVDSEELESGEMSKQFKKIAAREIATFKEELFARFPERRGKPVNDDELMREVMNTVGKPGKLGEQIRCVVSVSMLTEGWDASTVTHILGIRKFGTQLICEQVVGRGLRRRSYDTRSHEIEVNGKTVTIESYEPEFAEVYGVPFNFARVSGTSGPPTPVSIYHVQALDERIECEITFPRVMGYRYSWPTEKLNAQFTEESSIVLSPEDFATRTTVSSIIGDEKVHQLDDLIKVRKQEVAFHIARDILSKYYNEEENGEINQRPWLFPQLVEIVKEWLQPRYVIRKDDTYLGLLLVREKGYDAAEKVYQAIVKSSEGEKHLLPILHTYNPTGSTRFVNFQTAKNVYKTSEDMCHLNYVVADTESWEQAAAEAIESMPGVISYVKNEGMGFSIPYTIKGREKQYRPDFIIRINDGNDDPLNLILEVSGRDLQSKAAKVATARNMWIPSVNNSGSFGRWAFVEVKDPYDLKSTVSTLISEQEKAI
ncbi:MAG: DEAD/DEAH box helicase family protein [Candidatus Electryonea clarkiae]|nr:DEAD/DEAH box helicase family protein [Candidatus Electryonea clarkiae]MDP8285928.1 DEAD/DEAH box helicase family protein [Candidatus Electryonea clarkiae]